MGCCELFHCAWRVAAGLCVCREATDQMTPLPTCFIILTRSQHVAYYTSGHCDDDTCSTCARELPKARPKGIQLERDPRHRSLELDNKLQPSKTELGLRIKRGKIFRNVRCVRFMLSLIPNRNVKKGMSMSIQLCCRLL